MALLLQSAASALQRPLASMHLLTPMRSITHARVSTLHMAQEQSTLEGLLAQTEATMTASATSSVVEASATLPAIDMVTTDATGLAMGEVLEVAKAAEAVAETAQSADVSKVVEAAVERAQELDLRAIVDKAQVADLATTVEAYVESVLASAALMTPPELPHLPAMPKAIEAVLATPPFDELRPLALALGALIGGGVTLAAARAAAMRGSKPSVQAVRARELRRAAEEAAAAARAAAEAAEAAEAEARAVGQGLTLGVVGPLSVAVVAAGVAEARVPGGSPGAVLAVVAVAAVSLAVAATTAREEAATERVEAATGQPTMAPEAAARAAVARAWAASLQPGPTPAALPSPPRPPPPLPPPGIAAPVPSSPVVAASVAASSSAAATAAAQVGWREPATITEGQPKGEEAAAAKAAWLAKRRPDPSWRAGEGERVAAGGSLLQRLETERSNAAHAQPREAAPPPPSAAAGAVGLKAGEEEAKQAWLARRGAATAAVQPKAASGVLPAGAEQQLLDELLGGLDALGGGQASS